MACASQLDSMRSPSSPIHRVKLSVLSGRADRFKERREKNPKHKEERYNIYGFIFAFQVWAFEAIFSLMAKKHAVRVSKDIPRILSWEASTTPNYEDLRKEIFAKKTVPTMRFLNPTDEERQQPYFTDLLDEDVPLPAELEPDDPYETAYETDAAAEDNDGGDDCEGTQTDETAEVGYGGDVEAQETALVFRKSPHKIRQQSCFATTATSYASDSFVKKVDELSSEIKNLRSEMITKQEISSQLKSFQDKEDDQGVKEGECTVRDHPVEIGSDAVSHDPDASVFQLDKQPKGMIKAPRIRKRSADTSSPFTDSMIRKQKK
ncbi:hypothetical protein QYF36_014105 [Acer negundo]|nr:hypothetical protein QYF36_014105 [Acer negundo]